MFAALEFSVAMSGAGVQPIIGCQVDVTYLETRPGDTANVHLPLWCSWRRSETGYENLMKLNSCLYVGNDGQLPQVTVEELAQYGAGIICLTGGPKGAVGQLLQGGQHPAAQRPDATAAKRILEDRLYVELQRHPGEQRSKPDAERLSERGFVEMAYAMDLPLVATNDVYFPIPKCTRRMMR